MSGIIKPPFGAQLNRDHPLAQGLVGAWLFNEGAGNKLFDYSGGERHGALINFDDPPTSISGWSPGPDGGALIFDWATNTYVDLGAQIILDNPTNWSIAMQVILAADHWYTFPASFNFNLGPGYGGGIDYEDGYWSLIYNDSVKENATAALDQWAALVGVSINNTTFKIYKDGLLCSIERSNSGYGVIGNKLGYGWGGNYLPGLMNYVYLWNRALSAEEVAYLYAFPYAMFEQPAYPAWMKSAGGILIHPGMNGGLNRPVLRGGLNG